MAVATANIIACQRNDRALGLQRLPIHAATYPGPFWVSAIPMAASDGRLKCQRCILMGNQAARNEMAGGRQISTWRRSARNALGSVVTGGGVETNMAATNIAIKEHGKKKKYGKRQ